MSRINRGGAGVGLALGFVPALVLAHWAQSENPWFLDAPMSFLLWVGLPPMLLGALLGGLLLRGVRVRGRGGPLALAAMGGIFLMLTSQPTPGPVDTKLFVYGVDGASWELIDGMELPTFQALKAEGAHAVLHSAEPMFSPLLWTTLASGRTPDQHGIRGFRTRADQARVARFWDVAAEAGMKVGLYKWLVSWPPPTLAEGSFVVPAWLAPEPDTLPADLSFVKEIELSRRLKRKRKDAVRPGWKLALAGIPRGLRWSTLREAAGWSVRERLGRPSSEERAWRLQLLRVRMDRDVFISALHRAEPAVATFTTYATDALGHSHWNWMARCTEWGRGEGMERTDEPCPDHAQALPEAYAQADAILGEILGHLAPDATVMVVSDHGFRPGDARDAGRYFTPTTERLRARLVEAIGPVDVARMGHKVTIALQAEDADAQREALTTTLQGLLAQSTGEPFYTWESIPDQEATVGLTLRHEQVDAARLASDTVGGEPIADYVRLTDPYSGEHDRDGILLAKGPQVPQGTQLEPAELIDVAPTMLNLLGLPISREMEGTVLFGPAPTRVDSHRHLAPDSPVPAGDEDVNMEMLKELGYIE